jgi:hypothetical protein
LAFVFRVLGSSYSASWVMQGESLTFDGKASQKEYETAGHELHARMKETSCLFRPLSYGNMLTCPTRVNMLMWTQGRYFEV